MLFKHSKTKGVSPEVLGIGPIPAVTSLLTDAEFTMADIDAVELNEAFASQVIASQHALKIPDDKLNIYGGALAMGHPYGASGAAIVTRLFYMNNKQRTIATMGIGGGMGMQSYLNDGEETLEINFSQEEVVQYYSFSNNP